jgi:hypothetical protein
MNRYPLILRRSTMSAPEPREIPLAGDRLRFDSSKNLDEVVDALLADVGEKRS